LEQLVDQILSDAPVPPPLHEREPELLQPKKQTQQGKMQITSPYGERTDPLTGKKDFHHGVDLAAKNKDGSLASIYSIGKGVVIEAGWQDGHVPKDYVAGKSYTNKGGTGYGLHVRIQHPSGFVSTYGHMSEVFVQKGDQVEKGQHIGTAGQTGRVTSYHLHLSLKNQKGQSVDPMRYIKN